jgi:uncharacterized protein (TIGR03437 family)
LLRPGREVVVLYGTGFGATSPPTPAGTIVSSAHPLESLSALTISGGVTAKIVFAGVTATGLYQFNVKVPATLSRRERQVVAAIDSTQTQAGTLIPVHHLLSAEIKPAGRRSGSRVRSHS